MSITCQVTQRTASRICLSVPEAAGEPESSQCLAQFVLRLPGVAGVEIWPASKSLVILHNGGRPAGDAILNVLRGKQLPADPPQLEGGESAAAGKGESRPYARCEVLHALRGRVRLRIPVLKTDKGLAGALSNHLSQQPGVKSVRLSPLAAAIVIAFDPAITDAQAVVDQVVNFNPEPAEIERWRSEDARALDADKRRSRQKLEFTLALGAVALPVVLGAPAALLIYVLLWGSIVSIVERSYRFVFKDRRAAFDILAAITMALLVLSGMTWQAALVPVAFAGIAWLRSRMRAQTAQGAGQDSPDEVVIFLPPKKAQTDVVAPAQAMPAHAAAVGPNSNGALGSSILGGLAVWVASRSLRRGSKKAGR